MSRPNFPFVSQHPTSILHRELDCKKSAFLEAICGNIIMPVIILEETGVYVCVFVCACVREWSVIYIDMMVERSNQSLINNPSQMNKHLLI